MQVVDNPKSDPQVFHADPITAIVFDDSQLVMLKLKSGNYLPFLLGAQCTIILVESYGKATKDYELEQATPLNTYLKAYGGSKLTVHVCVWCDNFKYQLDCKLVDNNVIRPLLVRKAKERAISECLHQQTRPESKDCWDLCLVQYLSKFLPHLSHISKPLRDLKQSNVKWVWGPAQQAALEALKRAVVTTPVVHYYILEEEVTLQVVY